MSTKHNFSSTQIKLTTPDQLGDMLPYFASKNIDVNQYQILGYFSDSNECKGFAVIENPTDANFDLAWLNFLVVDSKFRGQGIASQLIKSVCDRAKIQGFRGVRSIIDGVFELDNFGGIQIPSPKLVRKIYGSGGIDSLKAHLKVYSISISKSDFIKNPNDMISLVCSIYFESKFIPENALTTDELIKIQSFLEA